MHERRNPIDTSFATDMARSEHGVLLPYEEVKPVENRESSFPYTRIVVVENRHIVEKDQNGAFVMPVGGLSTALDGLMQEGKQVRQPQLLIIGWHGKIGEQPSLEAEYRGADFGKGVSLDAFSLTQEEHDRYYLDVANRGIWPLFHEMTDYYEGIDQNAWDVSKGVMKKVADTVMKNNKPDDFTFIQDYQMIGEGEALREKGVQGDLGFFLHIPFPRLEVFQKLPKHIQRDIVHGFLAYDIVGLQRRQDQEKLRDVISHVLRDEELIITDKKDGKTVIQTANRKVLLGDYGIGLDPQSLQAELAGEKAQEARARLVDLYDGDTTITVGRADYTKAYPKSIQAMSILRRNDASARDNTYVVVAKNSRTDIPAYKQHVREIEETVEAYRKEHGEDSIAYYPQGMVRPDTLALMSMADTHLVTPDADGHNLTADEAAEVGDPTAALVLGEGAGSADRFREHAFMTPARASAEKIAGVVFEARHTPLPDRMRRKQGLQQAARQGHIGAWAEGITHDIAVFTGKK